MNKRKSKQTTKLYKTLSTSCVCVHTHTVTVELLCAPYVVAGCGDTHTATVELLCAWGGDSSVVRGAGLVIERSRVRIPAGTAGEFSSPGSTFLC